MCLCVCVCVWGGGGGGDVRGMRERGVCTCVACVRACVLACMLARANYVFNVFF